MVLPLFTRPLLILSAHMPVELKKIVPAPSAEQEQETGLPLLDVKCAAV